jgi:hypothetical protein
MVDYGRPPSEPPPEVPESSFLGVMFSSVHEEMAIEVKRQRVIAMMTFFIVLLFMFYDGLIKL